MSRHTVAAVQMTSGSDKSKNLATARRLVSLAAERGASLVALPELFNCLAQPDTIVSQAEPIPGPTSQALSELAAKCQDFDQLGQIRSRLPCLQHRRNLEQLPPARET